MACTPLGCIELLEREQIPIAGSARRGHRPQRHRREADGAAAAASRRHGDDLPFEDARISRGSPRSADILVAAIGRPGFVTQGVRQARAQRSIDVGINTLTSEADVQRLFAAGSRKREQFAEKGRVLVGDVHPEVEEVAGALTPVPGGVGPLTIAMVLRNTITAAEARGAGKVAGRMRRIALTGGIGTGKTHVLDRFRDRGVPVIDADVIAREVVQPGSLGLRGVVKRFGPGVLTPEGTLDRARLGEIVFRDTDARRDLEAILHPLIRAAMEERFRELPPDTALAIADVPLLYETGRQRHFDRRHRRGMPARGADRARHGARRPVARGRGASCRGAAAHRFENGARRSRDPHRRVVRGNGSASGQVARAVTQ